jgi:hypothetical protein
VTRCEHNWQSPCYETPYCNKCFVRADEDVLKAFEKDRADLRSALASLVEDYEAVSLLWEAGSQSRYFADKGIRNARALLERTANDVAAASAKDGGR